MVFSILSRIHLFVWVSSMWIFFLFLAQIWSASERFFQTRPFGPPPCMAGQIHCTPPCMVAGYTLPRGRCMAPMADVGWRGPRRGSWWGRGTLPWIMAGYAHALLSRPSAHLCSFLSLSHPEGLSFSPSLTPECRSSPVPLPAAAGRSRSSSRPPLVWRR